MSKRAFDKIAEGLREAIAVARGEKRPAKIIFPEPAKSERNLRSSNIFEK